MKRFKCIQTYFIITIASILLQSSYLRAAEVDLSGQTEQQKAIAATQEASKPYQPLFGIENEHRFYLADGMFTGIVPMLSVILSHHFHPNTITDITVGVDSYFFGALFSAVSCDLARPILISWLKLIKKFSPQKYEVGDFGRISFQKSRFYLEIGRDPTVIEVTMKPSELDQVISNQIEINDILFKYPRFIGIHSALVGGGNHIHLDRDTAFGDDALLLRNFVVDFVNHTEIALGALVYDPVGKALPPFIGNDRDTSLRGVINRFDRGEIKDRHDLFEALLHIGFGRIHALNLHSRHKSIEIRGNRSAKNIETLIMTLTLFQKRLEYLRSLKTPIPLLSNGAITSRRQGVNQFYLYVTESGLDWNKYKKLLPLTWRYIKPDPLNAFIEQRLPKSWKARLFRCDLFLSNFIFGI